MSRQPAWPAAPFLLLRFAALLQGEKGLRHPDQHVRQYCVDMLGSMAAQLYSDEKEAAADADLLRQLAERDSEGRAGLGPQGGRLGARSQLGVARPQASVSNGQTARLGGGGAGRGGARQHS